jgi:tetratricopeptide (TPR) repeat protein
MSYNNIGLVYKSLNLYDDAVFSFEKSLQLKTKSIKNNEYNLSIATTLNNLGLVYKGKGDL